MQSGDLVNNPLCRISLFQGAETIVNPQACVNRGSEIDRSDDLPFAIFRNVCGLQFGIAVLVDSVECLRILLIDCTKSEKCGTSYSIVAMSSGISSVYHSSSKIIPRFQILPTDKSLVPHKSTSLLDSNVYQRHLVSELFFEAIDVDFHIRDGICLCLGFLDLLLMIHLPVAQHFISLSFCRPSDVRACFVDLLHTLHSNRQRNVVVLSLLQDSSIFLTGSPNALS